VEEFAAQLMQMAEGEGFEPPVRFPVQRFSSTQEGSDRL
jgi:hypothetical protein